MEDFLFTSSYFQFIFISINRANQGTKTARIHCSDSSNKNEPYSIIGLSFLIIQRKIVLNGEKQTAGKNIFFSGDSAVLISVWYDLFSE